MEVGVMGLCYGA